MGSEDGGAPGCVFCDIARGRSPAWVVYEDPKSLAFLDLFPITRGHLLVVPRHHVDRLTELDEADYRDYLKAIAAVCRRVERLSHHYNVTANQGQLAGQIVYHLHFHIMPRYGSDDPFTRRPRTKLDDQEARAIVELLRPD
jgi:histidine triad (HIT) family protein